MSRNLIVLCNFIEIALRHGCSPVNLLHIFRTPFPKNTSGWLLLLIEDWKLGAFKHLPFRAERLKCPDTWLTYIQVWLAYWIILHEANPWGILFTQRQVQPIVYIFWWLNEPFKWMDFLMNLSSLYDLEKVFRSCVLKMPTGQYNSI